MFEIVEHKATSYAPRTYVNASSAHLTIAIASDFGTAGERLTKKAAGSKYMHMDINQPAIENARRLYSVMKYGGHKTLNIAGNGIYTLDKFGFSQEQVNLYVYEILSLIHTHIHLDKVVSGMQSGVDLAGAVSAKVLDIPFVGTMPRGYKQRWEDGIDVINTEEDIFGQVAQYCELLTNGLMKI
jgi:hypothetical protein